MENTLYMQDSYQRECDAKIKSVSKGKHIVLDRNIFYPSSGGVEWDTGKLIRKSDNCVFNVIFVGKFSGAISHEVDGDGLHEGEEVHCVLDWGRRYLLMRYHTAAHILSGYFAKELGALITGNQLTTEKGRIDFSLENFDRQLIDEMIKKSNELIKKDLPVEVYYLPREEALQDPNMVKLANALPPAVEELRVVDIKGFDYQADGGCHVKSLKEVGRIEFLKAENKGKSNRRVYFRLS
ncbi:alanyl-tRNA editing protein [Candidatus Woesearchaeota archaeon]|nr:alanyl-tRNA editing protein [Candidatus Woesearchaeota archaeon]